MLIRDWSSYVVSSDRVRRAFPRARRAVFRGASRRRPRRADRRRRAARDGVAPPSELGLCPRRGPDSGDDRIYRLPLGDAVRLVFLRRAGDATDARRRTADRRRLPDRRAQDPARRPDRTGGGVIPLPLAGGVRGGPVSSVRFATAPPPTPPINGRGGDHKIGRAHV